VRADTRSVKGGAKNDLVMENVIEEIDVKTNKVLFSWNATKALSPSESYLPLPKNPDVAFDFVHANAVNLDTDGNLLVSARNTHTIYKVSKSTGEILWKLSGKKSTFKMGAGSRFRWQHDAHRDPDGTISLFDNATTTGETSPQARGLKLRVDEASRTVTRAAQFTDPKKLVSPTQGNLQVLANGNYFVGWGGRRNNVTEFSADGKVLFEARYQHPLTESYRAYRAPWSAQPTVAPKAVARRSGKSTAVRVSWNGATTVASWRVLGGPSATSLVERQVKPRTSFETMLRYPGNDKRVVVEALAADGRVLGRTTRVVVGEDGW
jgi:hypothetical protein